MGFQNPSKGSLYIGGRSVDYVKCYKPNQSSKGKSANQSSNLATSWS